MRLLPPDRRNLHGGDQGYVAIFVAISLLAVLIIVGFVTDGASWLSQGRTQQRAADFAALSGLDVARGTFETFDTSFPAPWSPDEAEERTRLGLLDAIPEIVDSLYADGILATTTPVIATTAGLPSTASIIDGDVSVDVQLTLGGHLTVDIEKPGDQFLSQLAIGAPSIGRTATARLSDCGATCTQPIEVPPPFNGIKAIGSGDGYTPIVAGNRVFAINHHTGPSPDGLACMDIASLLACSDFNAPLGAASTYPKPLINHTLSVMGVAHDEPSGRFYFIGTLGSTLQMTCFDYTLDAYCGTADLLDPASRAGNPNHGRGNGPELIGGRLFAYSDNGQMHCVVPDETSATNSLSICPGYPADSGAVSAAGVTIADVFDPAIFPESARGSTHTEAVGTKVFGQFYAGPEPDELAILTCWETTTNAPCSGWTTGAVEVRAPGSTRDSRTNILFTRFSGGSADGICVAGDNGHRCFDLETGAAQADIAGFDAHIWPTNAHGIESGFVWKDSRSYFTQWNSSTTWCWNWDTGSGCGVDNRNNSGPGGENIEQYDFAEFSDNCIIGFGDESIFYTFTPDFGTCLETDTTTRLEPCTCVDGTRSWGELRLPTEILNVTTSAIATITLADGTVVLGPHDLFTGLTVDLSFVPGTVTELFLTIETVPKASTSGVLEWQATLTGELDFSVRPTLID